MGADIGPRRWLVTLFGVGALGIAVCAGAGPWSSLPDAVTQLQRNPGDGAALQVLKEAESSLLVEAAAGHLEAVVALMDAYENLVTPLADGYARCTDLRSRASDVLVIFGDSRVPNDPQLAGQAWALAASLHPHVPALERLRRLLLPPPDSDPGDVWRSPIDGAEMVFHPSLQFQLGCSFGDGLCMKHESGRFVSVGNLWVERNEVTNQAYSLCVEAGACPPPVEFHAEAGRRRSSLPVVGLSFRQARTYADWVGRRLPSEAEWERAARGFNSTGRFAWGRGRHRGLANLHGRGDEDTFEGLAPVGSFSSTGLGVNDLAGNVWEWCADTYHPELSQGPIDGKPWSTAGWGRVLRGGSWRRTIEVARVSSRTWHEEDYFADDVGFRTVVDVPEAIEAQKLIGLARRTYLPGSVTFRSLAAADLSTADRRYLERMALTWLVLEGRLAEALPVTVSLLRQDSRDPVALNLLEQLEKEMASNVQRGDLMGVEPALVGYRRAVQGDQRLARRLAAHERRLMEQMRVNLEVYVDHGNPDLAAAGLGFARLLDPGDPLLRILMASIEPAPGTARVSRRDQREMVWVPGGEFRMGASAGDGHAGYDEHPARDVTVSGFWLDRNEVTNDDYRRCVDAGVCTPPHRATAFNNPRLGRYPVLWVDWFQARTYAAWAGKRLPTEAEWEWAARAGQPTVYPWGDSWLDGRGNVTGLIGLDRWPEAAPVASFSGNPWGLHDMLGNAGEWVQDAYHRNYWGAPSDDRSWMQLTGPQVERRRVVRGGSFMSPSSRVRPSERADRSPWGFSRTVGFRCAMDP